MKNAYVLKATVFSLLFLIFLTSSVYSQEDSQEDKKRNKLTLSITHTLLPAAISENGHKTWLSLASWGLDYDREINEAWSVGLHSDAVIQNFKYEHDDIIKDRNSPIALALVAKRKFGEHFGAFGGGGLEVSKGEETLGLIRIGADLGWEIPGNWEFAFSAVVDFKVEAYNALVFGFGVGKKF